MFITEALAASTRIWKIQETDITNIEMRSMKTSAMETGVTRPYDVGFCNPK